MAVISRPSYGILGNQHYHQLRSDSCQVSIKPNIKPNARPSNSEAERAAIPYEPGSKRKVAMALVDLCTAYIERLWPKQDVCKLPVRKFVFEILRRSRIQYPIFQVALCYMARLQPVIRYYRDNNLPIPPKLACGRRVLVAALQVATKFLQDHCYSADVWARISGLPKHDLVSNELALMEALQWKLFISSEAYVRSCNRLRVTVDNAFAERAVVQREQSTLLTPNSSPSLSTLLQEPEAAPEVQIWTE